MKKLFKMLLLTIVMSLMFSIPVFADVTDYANHFDYRPASGTYTDGPSKDKCGYLIYVTDYLGNAVTTGKFVTYRTNMPRFSSDSGYDWFLESTNIAIFSQPGDINFLFPRYEGGIRNINGEHIRLRGVELEQTVYNNIIWDIRPYDGQARSNEAEVTEWLKSPQGGFESGLLKVVDYYWGADARQEFMDSFDPEHPERTHILHVEVAFWHGLYVGGDYTGKQILSTAPWMAVLIDIAGSELQINFDEPGSGYPFKKYDCLSVPNSFVYDRQVCGIDPAINYGSSYIPTYQIQALGYGIGAYTLDSGGNKKVIKSFYEDEDTLIETVTEPTDDTVDMQEPDFEVVEWITTEDILPEPPDNKEYEDIIDGVPVKRSDDEEEDLELDEDENTVVIKYIQTNSPYTIVKSYYNEDTFIRTRISSTSDTDYTIENEDDYEVVSYFTTSQEPSPKPTRTTKWDTIISRYNNSDTIEFDWDDPDVPKPIEFSPDDNETKTIFIKYVSTEGTPPPEVEVESDNVVKAWELNYIFPDLSTERKGTLNGTFASLENILLHNATGLFVNQFVLSIRVKK